METGFLAQELFLKKVETILKKQKKTKKELCDSVWPSSATPQQIWQHLTKPHTQNGKKRSLSIDEAIKISHFLGIDFIDIFWSIEKELKVAEIASTEKKKRKVA